jgi:hypothetical protein
MARIIFVRGGIVAQVAMGERADADAFAVAIGADGWAEATAEPADVLREVEEGDAIAAPLLAGTRELNKSKVNVTRYGVKFVTNGVRDYAKLAQAQALAPQPVFAEE